MRLMPPSFVFFCAQVGILLDHLPKVRKLVTGSSSGKAQSGGGGDGSTVRSAASGSKRFAATPTPEGSAPSSSKKARPAAETAAEPVFFSVTVKAIV